MCADAVKLKIANFYKNVKLYFKRAPKTFHSKVTVNWKIIAKALGNPFIHLGCTSAVNVFLNASQLILRGSIKISIATGFHLMS